MNKLDETIKKLGEGSVLKLDSGEFIFKLASFEGNPIVKPQDLGLTWYERGELKIGAIFNGGAEIFQGRIILMPRCHKEYYEGKFVDERTGIERICLENYVSEVWPLISDDSIHFTRYHNVAVQGNGTDHQDFIYGIEDIRIVKYNQLYLLVGCGKVKPPFKYTNADRVAIYSTSDFLKITYHGMINTFDSRNAVPFSEQVNGRNPIFLRFHPNIHLDFLDAGIDQLLDPLVNREYWQKIYDRRSQSLLLEVGHYPHEKEKIGPSTQVIKTDRGWLFIYHAVGEIGDHVCNAYGLSDKIERGYSICAALLDLNDPRKVLCRTQQPLYIPSATYELYGDDQYSIEVPAVVFPVGAFVRKDKLILYAGAADKYVILLSCNLEKLLEYLWIHCKLGV